MRAAHLEDPVSQTAASSAPVAVGAPLPARGYAATAPDKPLGPFSFERRSPGPKDVHIDILFCGICHSDLHQARDEWGGSAFPMVPGHEIVGRVRAVGNRVTRFKVGDLAAVGCMVDSCRSCPDCREGLEQFCTQSPTWTYNSADRIMGGSVYGGYSDHIVVDEAFTFMVSETLDPAGAAPLLCAGITTWSPLKHWKVGKGSRVGIVGLGGLGHMGVKLAKALGADVSLFTTSASKITDGMRLGADEVILTRDPDDRKGHSNRFDFIINTVAVSHDLGPYLRMLKRDSTMCLVGVPEVPHPAPAAFDLIARRRSLAGSPIGGMKETQEMLDFCAKHNIVSDVEVIPIQQVNTAY